MPTPSAPDNGNRNDKQQERAPAQGPGREQSVSPTKSPSQSGKTRNPDVTYDDEDDGQHIHFLF